MFTVVIAQKELIDSIEEYRIFLSPFLQKSKVRFCAWDTECQSNALADMVPTLVDTVNGIREWRALVLCDEHGLTQKNPFDLVEYQRPRRKIVKIPPGGEESELEPLEEYLKRVQEAKFKAYAQAQKNPLTRLMAYLCEIPIVSPMLEDEPVLDRGTNGVPAMPKETPGDYDEYRSESAKREALEYDEYSEEGEYRATLLRGITGNASLEIALPAEILCVARRTCAEAEYDISSAWTHHLELQYSEFYDWNLYFDKMRYLVFDLLPRGHKNYTSDYIRFLYVVLLLANHQVPSDSLRPNRVYCLNCENDDDALNGLMSAYDTKLALTLEMLNGKYHKLEMKTKSHLTDKEAASIFVKNTAVPVVINGNEADQTKFIASTKAGFFTDRPVNERYHWDGFYTEAKEELTQFLKQPPRALKRAADDIRNMDQVDTERAPLLNSFQREDLMEYIGKEENAMAEVPTVHVGDARRFLKKTDQASASVQKTIETRMTRHTAMLLGGTVMLLMLLGFLPMLIGQASNGAVNVLISIGLTLAALALLALTGIFSLASLRDRMRNRYRWFNQQVDDVVDEVDHAMTLFSEYLSHACNVMRGVSVLNYCDQHEDPDTTQMRILKKHMIDIQSARAYLREAYGGFLEKQSKTDMQQMTAYAYNFERAVDFEYPPPYTEALKREILFMQPGSSIQVPVNFIKSITVKREELYD